MAFWFELQDRNRCELIIAKSHAESRDGAPAPESTTHFVFVAMNYDGYSSDDSSLSTLRSSTPSPQSVPSSPLSSSRSISPPPNWRLVTPPPSQDAGEDMPPARKRRKIEPRIRTTRHLDLTYDYAQSEHDRTESLELMLKALRKRRKIVVVAGAGISVSAGIPDFRSSHGLFRSLRGELKLKNSGKELFDASVYKDDSSTSSFHDMVRKLSRMASNAKPTSFHHLLARLSSEGRLLRLYTQNVDGLETELPPLRTEVPLNHKAPWPQTIQLHGGLEKMICQKCRHVSDFEPDLFDGPVPPSCPECEAQDHARTTHAGKRSHGVGKLRPRMVLYNEHNPDEEAIGAVTAADFRTRPDAVVVVGTSMKIPAVRRIVHEMCSIVRDRKEGTTIWINRDPEPTGKDLENLWDLIVKGDSDEVAQLANMRDWDDDTPDIVENYTDSDVERVRSSQGEITVEIKTPKKQVLAKIDLAAAAMTPPMSPKPRQIDIKIEETKPLTPKITINIPAIKKPALTLKNPASKGRKVSHVISDNEGKLKSKISLNKRPAGRPMKEATKKNGSLVQQTIFGKTTKSTSQQPAALPMKKPEPLSPRQNSNLQDFPSKVQIMRADFSSAEGSPMPETPPGMMRQTPPESGLRTSSPTQQETISPKGSVPKGMEDLLN